ncbi:hypothetical protein [Nitrosomonas communis]|uniref:Uncharacterized protein n=1 Tax=Nitrosomonas communis TaxID=44574 RepID=A0A1I4LR07_9PROT|nr:hypothetical protein [Nitrosomonas communis]SFL93528.1 hypothetical protein SAMN05421863_100759 [Nitrosomonas communis]
MSMLTYITQAEIKNAAKELDGKVLTRPALLVTDGLAMIYAVDVDIGQNYPLKNVPIARANRNLLYAEVGAAVRLRRSESGHYEVIGFSQEQPGSFFRVPITLPSFTFGNAGIITGANPALPPSPLPTSSIVIGEPQDNTLVGRPLTYAELAMLGTYGLTPYGATGIFKGGVLQEIYS